MSSPAERFANIGAEEGEDWRRHAQRPAVHALAALWEALFVPQPVFGWLANDGLTAWLNTDEAAREASARGLRLSGPDPDVVRRVHDKAFALAVAEREGLVPQELRGCLHAFTPDELEDPDTARREIETRLGAWPAWLRRRFALKPRLGTSGRGRVSQLNALAGALPRLRARGGALLEPWLERSVDLSAQLHIAPGGELTLVGTTELVVSASGVYRGQRGVVDSRGRVSCDRPHDAALREAAVLLAGAAAREGFSGPCGLDAFAFRSEHGSDTLRPVVEFNARFTVGLVAIGLLRRSLDELRRRTGLQPGETRAFYFALEPPQSGWPEPEPPSLLFSLGEPPSEGPALLVVGDRDGLDAALSGHGRGP